jgi:hypothetical protein
MNKTNWRKEEEGVVFNFSEGSGVPLQKIWPFYKISEKQHKWDIYMP